ncbi:hypothetical protein [Citrobacter phage Tr1]|nr:hypothetical protein [Citrobacter phage Tr1]
MSFTLTETSKAFRYEVPLQMFLAILEKDSDADEDLAELIAKAGAYNIEYHGFYGSAIFFTIDVEEPGWESLLTDITMVIVRYVEGEWE